MLGLNVKYLIKVRYIFQKGTTPIVLMPASIFEPFRNILDIPLFHQPWYTFICLPTGISVHVKL